MPDLFDRLEVEGRDPAARRTDPDTSHTAAKRMLPIAGTDRFEVLKAHYHFQLGMTDFELAKKLGRQQTSVGKRRGELRDAGYIEQTKGRAAAPSGSPAIVWRITEKGKQRFIEEINP